MQLKLGLIIRTGKWSQCGIMVLQKLLRRIRVLASILTHMRKPILVELTCGLDKLWLPPACFSPPRIQFVKEADHRQLNLTFKL